MEEVPKQFYTLQDVEHAADQLHKGRVLHDFGTKVGRVVVGACERVVHIVTGDDEDPTSIHLHHEDEEGNNAEVTITEEDERVSIKGRVGGVIMEARDLVVKDPVTNAIKVTVPIAIGSLFVAGIAIGKKRKN